MKSPVEMRSSVRRWAARLIAAQSRCTLKFESDCKFNVRLVCNGRGTVVLGRYVSVGYRLAPMLGDGHVLLQARNPDSVIRLGSYTELSNNISVVANQLVVIGPHCLIGDSVTIFDSDFHDQSSIARLDRTRRETSDGLIGSVTIGANVWIASRAIILRDVVIGDHSIIAAGSVVTGEIPRGVLAGGVPARVIRKLE